MLQQPTTTLQSSPNPHSCQKSEGKPWAIALASPERMRIPHSRVVTLCAEARMSALLAKPKCRSVGAKRITAGRDAGSVPSHRRARRAAFPSGSLRPRESTRSRVAWLLPPNGSRPPQTQRAALIQRKRRARGDPGDVASTKPSSQRQRPGPT